MATVLYAIFLFDLYALRIYMVAKEFKQLFNTYDFLKMCTVGLIINSSVKGLMMWLLVHIAKASESLRTYTICFRLK